MHNENIKLIENGKRVDGRALDELRKPLKLKLSVLNEADGSAYIEWGGNKIIAGVFGPKEALPRHLEDSKKAVIKCQYNMSTFASLEEHGRMGMNRRSIEISKVISEALNNIVLTEKYPKKMIEVFMTVLQAEGGTRIASFVAAVAALIDAGIPLKDIAVGVATGKADGEIILDLGKLEDNYGEADMPMVATKEGYILLLQMDGKMTKEEIEKAFKMFNKAKPKLLSLIRSAVKEKYKEEITKKLDM